MTLFQSLAVTFALATALLAQLSDGADTDKIWAVAAFVNHGERTPAELNSQTILTPDGAQQMLRQGRAFRARYLANLSDSVYDHISHARIQNINPDMIDNDVLDITSQTDDFVMGGATAFLQGLYPPKTKAWQNNSIATDMAHDYTEGSDNTTDYPLNGYQYANIRSLGILDPSSTAIQGNFRCSAWLTEMSTNLTQDPVMVNLYNRSINFYQTLFSTSPLKGVLDLEDANFWNAYDIYDYVHYLYHHNETVHNGLNNGTTILTLLNGYATIMERARNTYLGNSTLSTAAAKDVLYSIAGRTLANNIANQFLSNVRWDGDRDKMTLIFGSYEPILSFISISGILTQNTVRSGPFSSMPEPGAAMLFELYGEDPQNPDQMPTFDKLRVRFYYRANADVDADFVNYPLFNSSTNGTVSYATFMDRMQSMGVTAYQWCSVCGSTPAPWCINNYFTGRTRSSSRSIDPVVAGVVGAVIMAAIAAVISTALYCFAGLRVKRQVPNKEQKEQNNPTGGFKGPEKKDEDKDVAVTKEGFRHERSGSWELKDGKTLPAEQTSGVTTKDKPRERGRSFDNDDDDDISVMGATPVKEHESV